MIPTDNGLLLKYLWIICTGFSEGSLGLKKLHIIHDDLQLSETSSYLFIKIWPVLLTCLAKTSDYTHDTGDLPHVLVVQVVLKHPRVIFLDIIITFQAANLAGFRASEDPRFEAGIPDFMNGILNFSIHFNVVHRKVDWRNPKMKSLNSMPSFKSQEMLELH